MIFVKDSLNGVNETQVNESGMQEDLELSNFLNQFQDVFIDDIPRELPPKQGDDDHMIELISGSSPPNKPPYRVSHAQQEEIMRQVNKLVEKGMGTIPLQIYDAQEWINRVRTELEDKVETFSQALVKEVLVSHLQDLEDANEEDEDNEDDDKEEQPGTSRHHQGLDDDDDQNDPRTGLSIGGVANEPSNPACPHSQLPPLAPEGSQPEHRGATRAIEGSQLQMTDNLIISIEASIGAKQTNQKQNAKSPKGMTLQSAFSCKQQVLPEDGSSRVHAFASPKKREKKSKRCIFIDDETSMDRGSVDGGSNSTLPTPQFGTELTLLPIEYEPQIPVRQVEEDFLKLHREKATTSTLKSISKDALQEATSKKKKKLSRKKFDFHTHVSDDNDEEESLPSPSQRDMEESKSCGASKSIMSESIIGRPKSEQISTQPVTSENIFTYVDALLLESIDDFAWHYIETWFQRLGSCYEKEYHLKGEVSEKTSTRVVPQYDRRAGEFVSSDTFPTKKGYLSELPTRARSEYTHVDELMVRGGAERTPFFFSWMLATFTDKNDHILDLFASCGALGNACSKEMRHCLMLEGDFLVSSECLQKKVCGPLDEED
ncbi:hypothetical protein L7F22_049563 [Adiantum nelumboides]|nr:hypothetical protein [Adiantum nelumboides]